MDYAFFVGTFLLAACLLALGIWRRGADVGQTRFFHNQTYHFQGPSEKKLNLMNRL